MKRNFLYWTRVCAAVICAFFALATLGGCSGGSDVEDRDDGYGDWNPDDWGDSDWNPGNEDNPNSGTCTITFWPCAPEGTPEAETLEPITVTVNVNSEYTLPDALFDVKGYFFLGWTYEQNSNYGLSPGYELYVPCDYDLYARWGTATYIDGLRISENMVVGYVKDELPADVVIPEGVTAIGSNVFYDSWEGVGCDIIKSVTIPASVQSIGWRAFWQCPNLEKVIIEDGSQLSEVGSEAFSECISLKNIELPESVKIIDYYTFAECSSLESVAMNGVKKIERYAFAGCKNLASVAMNNIEHIGSQAFFGCGFASVHLPNTLKFIGDRAFADCNLESVTIPDSVSVENIEIWAFGDCKRLKKVVLPDGWNEIKFGLFDGCESLEDVNFPSALKIIGGQAFSNCGFTEIILPESVTEIGNHAFSYCKSLSKVNLDNIKKIGGRAFIDSPLSEIIIPDDVELLCCEDDNHPLTFSLTTNTRTVLIPASVANEYMNSLFGFWNVFSNADIPRLPYQDDPETYYYDCTKIDIVFQEGATSFMERFLTEGVFIEFKSISIPNSVKQLGAGALMLNRFETITMPVGMTVGFRTFLLSSADIINYGGKKSEWEEFVKYIEEVGGNNNFTEAKIICADGTIEPTTERFLKPQR